MQHLWLWIVGGVTLALLIGVLGFVIWWLVEHHTSPPFPPPAPTYTLNVVGGTGSGIYAAGMPVPISASVGSGQTFIGWTPTAYVTSPSSPSTTFTMPSSNYTVTAQYGTSILIPPTGVGWTITT